MFSSINDIEIARKRILSSVNDADNKSSLESIRVSVLGRKGELTKAMRSIGSMDKQLLREISPLLNQLKSDVEAAISDAQKRIITKEIQDRVASEKIDITLPVRSGAEIRGKIHPITQTMREIISIFSSMGFTIAQGPDIENDFRNFSALNIGPDHPAKQETDTFYLPDSNENGETRLLRTHTSPTQIRTMLSQTPPIKIIALGRTYRSDSDITHTPMFHQVEGLVIDEKANMSELKWVLRTFCSRFFESENIEMRFRPSHFPFTEPSMEVDINCTHSGGSLKVGEGEDWLEILGCGMTHPQVLRNCGVDPEKYQGYAWGIGIDRLAMLKYSIPDLRAFYSGDLNWLRRYGFGITNAVKI